MEAEGVDPLVDWESDGGEDGAVEAEGEVEEDGGEGFYPEPPEEAKLFVGNIPDDVDSEKLAHLFEGAGIVDVAEVRLVLFFCSCVCFPSKLFLVWCYKMRVFF